MSATGVRWLAVAAISMAWAPASLMADAKRTTPTAPAQYLALRNPLEPDAQVLLEAKALYARECRKCHGADGKGRGTATRGMKVKPRDYTDSALMATLPDGQLFWIILNGSDAQTTEMSAYEGKLSEMDIWKLVLLIREFGR